MMEKSINMFQTTEEDVVWRPYPKYPFIEANQYGQVRTKDRYVRGTNGSKRLIKGRVLKQQLGRDGYMYVGITVNYKSVRLSVHRVVATCFLPNPDNLPEVNHKDNNRTNNVVSNLEWCSRQYNETYKKNFGTSQAEVSGTPVIAVNLKTGEIFYFETQCEAERQLRVGVGNIWSVLNGFLNKTCGYWFCYVNAHTVEKVRKNFGDKIAKEVEKILNDVT